MNKAIVSVVMPVCNMEPFLRESIESILDQTFREFELIILDFGSTDKSRAIVSEYAALDCRIKLHQISTCSLAEARNAGCSFAQGRYIAVQDADDLSLPDRLRAEVAFMEDNPGVGLVGSMAEWVDVSGKSMHVSLPPTDEEKIKSGLAKDSTFYHTSMLIRKEAFDRVGGYRIVMTYSHDYDLALRISEHYRCANLDRVLVKYRIHPNQVSLSKRHRQTLCKLAAQASATLRRAGKTDLLSTIREITPASLISMGVTEDLQELDVCASYQNWIDSLASTGKYATALEITLEALQWPWKHLGTSHIAQFHFSAARLYWKERKFRKCFLSLFSAVRLRPEMIKDIVKSVRWRLRSDQIWKAVRGHQGQVLNGPGSLPSGSSNTDSQT